MGALRLRAIRRIRDRRPGAHDRGTRLARRHQRRARRRTVAGRV